MAVDLMGADSIKTYAETKTFKTVIDSENIISNHFGFKVVPNGIFIDESGIIRFVKQGFRITEPKHVDAMEQLIKGTVKQIDFDNNVHIDIKNEVNKQLAENKFKLALKYLQQDKKVEALRELDEALLLDTSNNLIRKQRWYIRNPEKFKPIIDMDWQKEQLEKEKAEEMNKQPSNG